MSIHILNPLQVKKFHVHSALLTQYDLRSLAFIYIFIIIIKKVKNYKLKFNRHKSKNKYKDADKAVNSKE